MGLRDTTTNLTYARTELIKVGESFIFDKVGDMIYYMLANDDISTTGTVGEVIGSRTSGSGIDLGTYEQGLLVASQYTDAIALANTTDYVGCSAIFDLKLGRAITLASGGGYGFATIWANLEVDKAINATGAQSAAWMTIWADAAGDDAHIRGSSRLQVLDLAIVSGADFDASSSTKIYGLRIDSSLNASATTDGEFAAIRIEAAGTKKDWKHGIYMDGIEKGIYAAATSSGSARWTMVEHRATVDSDHTGQSVTAMRLYTMTTDGTGRTVGNLYGARIEANLKNDDDSVAGLMAGTQIVVELNDWDAGVSPANVTGLDIVMQETGTRATAPMSFIAMNDNDYAGSYPVAYVFDLGGLLSEIGTGDGKIYYHQTLKCKVSTTDLFIPMSTAQGTYTTAYPIVVGDVSGTTCADVTFYGDTAACSMLWDNSENGLYFAGTPGAAKPMLAVGTSGAPITYATANETNINTQIYSLYTGDTGYFRGLFSQATYTSASATGTASVYGIMGHTIVTKEHNEDNSERLAGVCGRFSLSGGTLNGAGIWAAGTMGQLVGGGTWTGVKYAAGVLASVQLSAEVGTGVSAAFVAYSSGTQPDSVLAVDGKFDYGIDFRLMDGTVDAAFAFNNIQGVAHSYGVIDAGNGIKVEINGVNYVIPVYAES